jgi:hypothetical protein
MLPLLVAALLPLPHVGLHVQESVDEGDSVRVAVTLDRVANRDVRVRLDTRGREARGRSDYGPVHGVVTIPSGLLRVTVPVHTVADGLDEADESFVVRLRDAENAVLTSDRATATIDDPDPTPRVRVEGATIPEPEITNQLGFTYVRLSAPSGRRVVVELATRPGSATTADFVPLHPIAVFAPGETSQLVSVEVLPDDLVEGPETVRLVVTSVRHALPPRRAAIVTIDDADD